MTTGSLLGDADPPPFRVERPTSTSSFVVTCDHASRRLPRRLGSLGLTDRDLARHIAWDLGIAEVAGGLSAILDASLIAQGYSRPCIDANRPPGTPESIVVSSDGRLLALLRDEPGLVVGDNQPYAATPATDHTIIVNGERRGLPYVELELRQDVIADARGSAEWAERLARLLPRAVDAIAREVTPC